MQIHWTGAEADFLEHLLCPSIVELRIADDSKDQNDALSSILSSLARTTQGLTAVHLDRSLHRSSQWIVDHLQPFRGLRDLSLFPPIRLKAFYTLTLATPNLVKLNLQLVHESIFSSPLFTLPYLTTLSVCCSGATVIDLFAYLQVPSLSKGTFSIFDDIPLAGRHRDYTTAIARALFPQVLRELTVTYSSHSLATAIAATGEAILVLPSVTIAQMLEPLAPASGGLNKFVLLLQSSLKVSADDRTFVNAAAGWRRLHTLHIDVHTWDETGPIPSANVLALLAAALPRLQELTLPYLEPRIDEVGVPAWLGPPHSLQGLFVADGTLSAQPSNQKDIDSLVDAIDRLFPFLDLHFGAFIRRRDTLWNTVFQQIQKRRGGAPLPVFEDLTWEDFGFPR